MSKVTLDMATFKALASDTRLDILKVLDGKRMSLKDISSRTNLNKATLHEHLSKLNEAGLVKKNEREGHKWVYYKLTWKGECLLHPENTRIVVLFTTTFITLFIGIIQLVNYVKGVVIGRVVTFGGTTNIYGVDETSRGLTGGYALSEEALVNLHGVNQTTADITQKAAESIDINGVLGNAPSPSEINLAPVIDGAADISIEKYLAHSGASEELTGVSFDGASSSVITWYDPSLQYIAIFCLIIFGILLSIGIWRLWKNKKSKI